MAIGENISPRSFVNNQYSVPDIKVAIAGQFVVASQTLTLQTGSAPHFLDLTLAVNSLVEQLDVLAGTVLVFSKHTTAAIVANEHEPLLLDDIADLLLRLAPPSGRYRHDDMTIRTVNLTPNEAKNGHAHCQHLFLGSSIQFPVIDGRLELGQWQHIFLVELDGPRTRQVVVQVSGVGASHCIPVDGAQSHSNI